MFYLIDKIERQLEWCSDPIIIYIYKFETCMI